MSLSFLAVLLNSFIFCFSFKSIKQVKRLPPDPATPSSTTKGYLKISFTCKVLLNDSHRILPSTPFIKPILE